VRSVFVWCWPPDDRRNESISETGDRFNVSGRAPRIAECFPEDGNVDGQDSIFDEGILPDAGEQISFGHEFTAVPDQGHQHVECRSWQRHSYTISTQTAIADIESAPAE
jgi:hypothetical protein